jgi:cytochrome c oxidase assembly factor CtaG/putative copper export protein
MSVGLRIAAAAALGAASVLALIWAFSIGGSAEAGLLDRIGGFVLWGLPGAKMVFNLAAACTLGALVLAAVGLSPQRPAYERTIRFAGAAAIVWTIAAVGVLVLNFVVVANEPFSSPTFGQNLAIFITEVDLGVAGAVNVLIAAAAAVTCLLARGPGTVALAGLLAFAGLFPPAMNSHAAGGADHADNTVSLVLHIAAAAIWIGGLLTLVVLRTVLREDTETVIRRYSALALMAFVALASSGVLAATAGIFTPADLLTPYGLILLAKTGAFVVLGLFGLLHREWTIKRMAAEPRRGQRYFWALVVVELAVMGAVSGLAAALGRTQTPQDLGLDEFLPEPALLGYLTQWRPDPLWILVCAFAVFFYLAGVRRLRRQGGTWPVRRTALWLAGVAVLFLATNGGVHAYQEFLFNAHVLTQMLLTVVVPLLLVPAAPLTLAERAVQPRTDGSYGGREIVQLLRKGLAPLAAAPYIPAFLIAGSLILFYYTPLLGWSATTQLGYSWMTLHALLIGLVFVYSLAGASRSTAARNTAGAGESSVLRPAVLAGTGVLFAVYGWALTVQAAVLELPWYTTTGRPFGPSSPGAAPELAGTFMWVIGAVALLATAAVVLRKRAVALDAEGTDAPEDNDGGRPRRIAAGARPAD